MACDPQTFSDITAPVWSAIRDGVQRQLGIAVAGDTGQASEKGFTVNWNYEPDAQRLTITCLDKPLFVPCGMVNGQIAKLIDQARGAA